MSDKPKQPTRIISSGNFMGNKMIWGVKECTLTKHKGDLKWKTRWIFHCANANQKSIDYVLESYSDTGCAHFPHVTNGKRVSLDEEERLYSYNLLPEQNKLFKELNDESNRRLSKSQRKG